MEWYVPEKKTAAVFCRCCYRGMCFGRNEMNEKIIRQIGDCKVNIVFGCSNPDLKENIMWTMMENYKSRLSEQGDKTVKSEDKKKSA